MGEILMKILIDFDGVLTDGKRYIGTNGTFYSLHSRDNAAIAELINEGYEVIIVTANNDPLVEEYARKRKCSYIYSREKDIEAEIAIGDSTFDIKMMVKAKKKFCPKDAHSYVKKIPGMIVLDVKGGEGVIENLLFHL